MKRSILRYITVSGLLILSFIIYSSKSSYADHSLGKECYGCHNLKSALIIVGSQSISSDESYLTTGPNNYVSGRPFDCSFCHDAGDDIPLTRFKDSDVETLTIKEESSHPVDVIGDEDDIGTNEIVCADCHLLITSGGTGYDIAPADLTTKDGNDGYPNHKFVELDPTDPTNPANFSPIYGGSDYPNDAINKAHLTRPYGKQTYTHAGHMTGIPDENRSVDWEIATNPEIDETELLCFLCHADANYTGTVPTFTGAWDDPAVNSSAYDIAAAYNDADDLTTTAGHLVTSSLGNLNANTKLPCFNCHDSHGAKAHPDPILTQNDKLILNLPTKYDNDSTFAVVTNYDWDVADGELVVCAGCHDTDQDTTTAGTIVEGLDPMDPYNIPPHAAAGVAANMTSSTVGCISINLSTGCHGSAHNPTIRDPGDKAGCWWCHGNPATTYVNVMDEVDTLWGRGGDFGENTTRFSTSSTIGEHRSAHNIDFGPEPAKLGGDDTIGSRARGSCTVCHTVEEWPNGETYHADGDPRNDFRNVDEGSEVGEFAGPSSEPVFISTSEGYRYDPPWLMCVDCHDNEDNETTEEYYTIIGNINEYAPLNLDEFFDVYPDASGGPNKFVYGSGDILGDNYDDPAGVLPDEMGDGLNATPLFRYDLQPYKAHYYQRKHNDDLYTFANGDEIPDNQTDPTDRTNYNIGGTAARIIDCLLCHNGHGAYNPFLYRSPKDELPLVDDIVFDGRNICTDCHPIDPTTWDKKFPPQDVLVKGGPDEPATEPARLMTAPPVTDRYLNVIPEHASGSGVSCANYKTVGNDRILFRCHNPHSPSCETCHSYPVDLLGVDHD